MASLTTLSDQELATLFRDGEEAAYIELYQRFKGILHLHAYRKLGNFEEAKDVVQELFAIIWDKRESLPLTNNFSGYLYQTLRNRIFNIIAHKKVESGYATSISQFLQGENASTDHKIRERDLAQRIELEINNLPPRMREVFLLSRRSYLSHKEIAQELNISESTVKNQIKNALKILRIKLGLILYIAFLLHK